MGSLLRSKNLAPQFLALTFASEFGFGHCDQFPVGEAGVQEGSG